MTEEERELAMDLLAWSRSLDNQILSWEDYEAQLAADFTSKVTDETGTILGVGASEES